MEYMCTTFGVDSSSHFPFTAWKTNIQTDRQANKQMRLNALPMPEDASLSKELTAATFPPEFSEQLSTLVGEE